METNRNVMIEIAKVAVKAGFDVSHATMDDTEFEFRMDCDEIEVLINVWSNTDFVDIKAESRHFGYMGSFHKTTKKAFIKEPLGSVAYGLAVISIKHAVKNTTLRFN